MSTQLISPADAYLQATNCHDAKAFHALFAENATVDDNGRLIQGLEAIEAWSQREIFDANVTLEVLEESERDGVAAITTIVEGNFDRTGLPDPVVIIHRITTHGDKIVELSCRLADL